LAETRGALDDRAEEERENRRTADPVRVGSYALDYAIAIHEAGHAVAQHRLGHPFLKVTIVPDHREGYLGMALYCDYSDAEYDAIEDAGPPEPVRHQHQ